MPAKKMLPSHAFTPTEPVLIENRLKILVDKYLAKTGRKPDSRALKELMAETWQGFHSEKRRVKSFRRHAPLNIILKGNTSTRCVGVRFLPLTGPHPTAQDHHADDKRKIRLWNSKTLIIVLRMATTAHGLVIETIQRR